MPRPTPPTPLPRATRASRSTKPWLALEPLELRQLLSGTVLTPFTNTGVAVTPGSQDPNTYTITTGQMKFITYSGIVLYSVNNYQFSGTLGYLKLITNKVVDNVNNVKYPLSKSSTLLGADVVGRTFTYNGSAMNENFAVAIDWGDGTSSMAKLQTNGHNSLYIRGTHTWNQNNTSSAYNYFNITMTLIVSADGLDGSGFASVNGKTGMAAQVIGHARTSSKRQNPNPTPPAVTYPALPAPMPPLNPPATATPAIATLTGSLGAALSTSSVTTVNNGTVLILSSMSSNAALLANLSSVSPGTLPVVSTFSLTANNSL